MRPATYSLSLPTLLAINGLSAPLHEERSSLTGTNFRRSKSSASLQKYTDEANWIKNKHEKTCAVPKISAGKAKQKVTSLSHSKSKLKSSKRGRPTTEYDAESGFMVWIDLQIGSTRTPITVVADTGSPDLAIPLEECEGCSDSRFDDQASTTFTQSEEWINTSFQDGCEIGGFMAFDTIRYSPPQGKQLKLKQQAFLAVSEDTSTRDDLPGFTAILGLDFDSKFNGGLGFVDNLVQQKMISRPYFSMYFADPDSAGNERSTICFGCIDQSKILTEKVDDIVYFDIAKGQNSWTIMSTGLYVDNTVVPTTFPFKAFIDTASTYIYVPSDEAEAFYSDIPGAKRYDSEVFTFPCGPNDDPLPLLFIGFGDQQYLLDPAYFNLGPMQPGSTRCIGAVMDKEVDGGAIIGGTFLRDKVVVFEQDKRRIGIVPAKKAE